ncbi:MAG: hypothetical protein EBR86_15510, partial [Planctomycetia bacterium]|nr:hypothetical protein [Planctomycetia bacterium]
LALAGFAAGFIDAIAGGGGLISLPALLAAGLPTHLALGTNKLQSAVGTTMAVTKYHGAGLIDWRDLVPAVLMTAVAAALGTAAVLFVDNALLERVIPWLLLGVVAWIMLRPRLGEAAGRPRLERWPFAGLAGTALGFYDGFFGPGTGAFWTAAWVEGRGLPLPRATAATKVVNLTSNVAALAVFLARGQVDAAAAAAMIVGQLLGGRLGATLAIRHGAPFIRVVFVAVVLALVARLLWAST